MPAEIAILKHPDRTKIGTFAWVGSTMIRVKRHARLNDIDYCVRIKAVSRGFAHGHEACRRAAQAGRLIDYW